MAAPLRRQRVLKASAWSFGLLAAEKLLGLVRVVVLALLLPPREFGLFGMAILAMMAVDAMTRTGFQQALIRDPRDITRQLDVAWSVQLFRGLLLAALLLLAAPFISRYFGESGAVRLTQAVALVLVFQGLSNIGIVYFQKELDFRKEFAYRFSGTLADLLAAVIGAWLLHSAWALVLGLLAGDFVRLLVSYRIHPYRPRIRFEKEALLELVRYGIWLSLAGTMLFIGSRAAGLVVGKIVGAAALGLYQMAYRIPQIAIREVLAALERIALPTYAQVQGDAAKLKRSYLGIGGFCLALAAPAATGIVILGPEFTRFFLGAAWQPMIPALILLAVAALIRAVPATGVPLFQATGVTNLTFVIQGARALVLAALIVPLTRHAGITGAALCMLLTATAGAVVWIFAIQRVLHLALADVRTSLLPPFVCALGMAGVLYPLKRWTLPMVPESMLPRLLWTAGLVLVGAAVYLGGLWLSRRILPQSVLLETVRQVLESRRLFVGREV